MVESERVAFQTEIEIASLFVYLSSCFTEDGGAQGDVNTRKGEGLKHFVVMNKLCNIRSVS